MTIVKTPLALTLDSTVDTNAQSYLHNDIDGTFVRYGITEAARRSYNIPGIDIAKLASPTQMLEQAKEIENGAAKQRRLPRGTPPAVELSKPTAAFFTLMAPWLAAELAVGAPQPNQPFVVRDPNFPQNTTLDTLYQLVYCSGFQLPDPMQKPAASVPMNAWNLVRQAVRDRSGNFDSLLDPCAQLCSAMADEFIGGIWPWVW